MANRGRRKIALTEERAERLSKSGKRLKALRKSKKYSQKDLAEMLHIAESTLRNYESGRFPLPPEIAEDVGKQLHVFVPYILGETDAQNLDEYTALQNALSENAPDDIEGERQRRLSSRRKFFYRQLGYLYEDHFDAAVDFAGIAPGTPPIEGDCRLSPLNGGGPCVLFSNGEMTALVSEMKNLVDFTCYKKEKVSDADELHTP